LVAVHKVGNFGKIREDLVHCAPTHTPISRQEYNGGYVDRSTGKAPAEDNSTGKRKKSTVSGGRGQGLREK